MCVLELLNVVTRTYANARTVRMMTQRVLSKLVKSKGKYLRNHSRGKDAIVGRIIASKTTVFAIKLACTVSQASVLVKAASTMMVHQRYLLQPLRIPRKVGPSKARVLRRQ